MIESYYIQGPSKADIRRKLAAGIEVTGVQYNLTGSIRVAWDDIPEDSVIKVWSKRDPMGQPIARFYGNKKGGKLV